MSRTHSYVQPRVLGASVLMILFSATSILAQMADARRPGRFPGPAKSDRNYHESNLGAHPHDYGGYINFPATRFDNKYRHGSFGHTRDAQRNGYYASEQGNHQAGFTVNYLFEQGGYDQHGFPPFQYRLKPQMLGFRSENLSIEPW